MIRGRRRAVAMAALSAVLLVVLVSVVRSGDDGAPDVAVAGDAVEGDSVIATGPAASSPPGTAVASTTSAPIDSDPSPSTTALPSTAPSDSTSDVDAAPVTTTPAPGENPVTPDGPGLEVRHEAAPSATGRWYTVIHEVTNVGDETWSTQTPTSCFSDPGGRHEDGATAPDPNDQVCADVITTWTIEPGATERFTSTVDTALFAPGRYSVIGAGFDYAGSFDVGAGRGVLFEDLFGTSRVADDWTVGALGVVHHRVEAAHAQHLDRLPCPTWARLLDGDGGVVVRSTGDCDGGSWALAAGEHDEFASVIDLAGLEPGTYRLQIWGLASVDEDVVVAPPEPGVDQVRQTVTVSESVRAGEAVVVTHVLSNEGDATWRRDHRQACSSVFVIDTAESSVATPFGSWCDEVQLSLAPGEERTFVHEVRVASTTEPGRHDVVIEGFIEHVGSLVVEPAEDESVDISADDGESR